MYRIAVNKEYIINYIPSFPKPFDLLVKRSKFISCLHKSLKRKDFFRMRYSLLLRSNFTKRGIISKKQKRKRIDYGR